MIIYEVNLSVDEKIGEEFLAWLQHHVNEMLAIEGFESARILQQDPADMDRPAQGQRFFTCQYELPSRSVLEHYFATHAQRMRGDGVARFGDQFSATRRILSSVEP